MTKEKATATGITTLLIVSCLIMYHVENSSNGYLIKPLEDRAFALIPLIYSYFDKNLSIKDFFTLAQESRLLSAGIGSRSIRLVFAPPCLCGFY